MPLKYITVTRQEFILSGYPGLASYLRETGKIPANASLETIEDDTTGTYKVGYYPDKTDRT